MSEPAQKREESAKPVRGRPFELGNRANPGGRPKGLAAKIRELAPAEDLAGYYLALFHRDGRTLRKLGIKVSEVTLADRTKAADWLADRGYGKAPIHAPVEGEDPLELNGVDTAIADVIGSIPGVLDELAARREAAAVPGDAEDEVAARGAAEAATT